MYKCINKISNNKMKRHSIHFRAGDLRPGTGQRRLQAPWRNVSEMSETSKQWIHPGSGGAKRRQVPAFPLNRGMSRSDRGLRQTESLHPSTRKPGRQGPGEFACGRRDNYRTIFEDFEAIYLYGIQIINVLNNLKI